MLSTSKSLLSLSAADIMSHNIVMIPREMSLQGAARLLTRANVTGAPIVDADGCCIGVLSATDIMHWVETDHKPAEHSRRCNETLSQPWQIPVGAQEPTCCVEQYMTKDPVLVPPGTRIGELARLMMEAHIHRIIVVDSVNHRPIGIVSSMDILAVLARVDQMQIAAEENKARENSVGTTR